MLSREVNDQLWLVMLLKVALVLLQYLFQVGKYASQVSVGIVSFRFLKLLFAFSLLVPVKQS